MGEYTHLMCDTQQRQHIREANEEALVRYLASGTKEQAQAFGIELEHTIIHTDGSAVSYAETHGIEWILNELTQFYPEITRDRDGDLLGLALADQTVTLEPAGQIELSAGPFTSLAQAYEVFESFHQRLSAIVEPHNMQVSTLGYHPCAQACKLTLIPKKRYQFMNRYFSARGPWGPRMMRGSASTQVSIDYTSEADCARKMRTALRLVPLLALITDNAPFFEGGKRPHQLMRTEIWEGCDPDRCGLVPNAIDTLLSWHSYAQFVLDVPAILTPCCEDEWCYSKEHFGSIYADRVMQQADVEHALSMIFTDVRLKTYLELRPADALPVEYVIAYTALIHGLFSHEASLDALDEAFDGIRASDVMAAKTALMTEGYQAHVYGRPVADLVDLLINLAHDGLSCTDRAFLEPLTTLVEHRTTLAEETLKALRQE